MAELFNCPSCGGRLQYDGGDHATIKCDYCGNTIIIPESLRARSASSGTSSTLFVQQNELQQIVQLINGGRKIEAIKLYRQTFDVGLKEAKEAVERLEAGLDLAAHHISTGAAWTTGSGGSQIDRTGSGSGRNLGCLIGGFGILVLGIIMFAVVIPLLTGGAAVWSIFSSETVATAVSSVVEEATAQPFRADSAEAPEVSALLQSFGTRGIAPGQFNDPRSIAVGPDGRLFVADYNSGRLQVFNAAGVFETQWALPDDTAIQAIAADRANTLYVIEAGDIIRYDQATGQQTGELAYESSNGLVAFESLAVAFDGTVVATNFFGEVVWLDAAGNVLHVVTEEEVPGAFGFDHVAVDGEGNAYVLGGYEDALGDRHDGVFIFNSAAQYVSRFGRSGREAGQLTSPNAIVVDGQGRIYISDFAGILIFANTGDYLATLSDEGAIFGLAINAQGELLATGNANKVFRYSPPTFVE